MKLSKPELIILTIRQEKRITQLEEENEALKQQLDKIGTLHNRAKAENATLKRENEQYKQMLEYIADGGAYARHSALAVLNELADTQEEE